jgi:(p)ppGpp synthase/HD superfamily hydrolase
MRKSVASMARTEKDISREVLGDATIAEMRRLRATASDIYASTSDEKADDFVFPFFDPALFEEVVENIHARDPMQGLPDGYGSALPHERLRAVSAVRIVLRPNNMDIQADTHNKTIENYIKLAFLSAGDREISTAYLSILLADAELHGVDKELAQQIFWLWGPFADVLGHRQIKNRLESLAMQSMFPDEYSRIDRELNDILGLDDEADTQDREMRLAEEARSLEEFLNAEFNPYDIRIKVSSRVKSHYSIWQKQQAQDTEREPVLSSVFDYLGFRVVVHVVSLDRDDILAACRTVDSRLCELFDRTWEADYISPKLQSTYKAIHSTALLPQGMFMDGAQAEFQVRSWEQDAHLEQDKRAYHYYSARKPVPGKKPSTHVRKAKHRIYDWRADVAQQLVSHRPLIEEDVLSVGEGRRPHVLVFDKYANLFLVGSSETVLDAMFRVHSDKVFRLDRLYHGAGSVDMAGRPSNLEPLRLEQPVWHGMRLVARYNAKGRDIPHPSWLGIVQWKDARKRINKKIKEAGSPVYIERGEEAVKRALEVERLGANHYRDLSSDDWQQLCNDYGLTVTQKLPAKELLLRDIGYGDQTTGRVVSYVQGRIRTLSKMIPIKEVLERDPEIRETLNGVPSLRAQCCKEIALVDGTALAIASRFKGGVMHIHSPDCSHMAGLLSASDPRLIPVKV